MTDIENFAKDFCEATPNPCHGAKPPKKPVKGVQEHPILHISEEDIGNFQTLETFWIECPQLTRNTCMATAKTCWQLALLGKWVAARQANQVVWDLK